MFLQVQKRLCKRFQVLVKGAGWRIQLCVSEVSEGSVALCKPIITEEHTFIYKIYFGTCKNTNGGQRSSDVMYRNLLDISRKGNLQWCSWAIWSGYNGSYLDSLIIYLTLFLPHKIASFQRRWVWANMNVSCKRKLSVTVVVTEYSSVLVWHHWVMGKKENEDSVHT